MLPGAGGNLSDATAQRFKGYKWLYKLKNVYQVFKKIFNHMSK